MYRLRRKLRLRISAKILVYFLGIALVPMLVVSFVLTLRANDQLLANASEKQQAVATDLARRIDNNLASNMNMLVFIARQYSSGKYSGADIDQSLSTLLAQNVALKKVAIMETQTDSKNSITSGTMRNYLKQDKDVVINDDPLEVGAEVFNFIANKPYIISVGRDSENNSEIGIGIPILRKYEPATNDLFASQSGNADNIIGAIVGYYSVDELWQSVLSTELTKGGYVYVVGNEGFLVAHPDKKFLASHRQLSDTEAVKQFYRNDYSTRQTVSESGLDVISTPQKTLTNWAVVVQEPVSSVYASINSYIQMAATIGISVLILSIIIGIFFSRQLIRPLRELTLGAKRMEHGDFDQPINLKSNDELQELADTFNGMANGIKKLIGDLKMNNMRLKFEQIKLNNIISSVSDGVIAVNSQGNIISINPPAAVLIDQNPIHAEGKPLSELFTFEHDGEPFTPDITNGGIYRYVDLSLNQGSTTAYLDMMVAVLDHQDSDVAAIITLHDQTASRELSFMKLDFVAIAAHELRTPLTVVRGYLDMLSTGTAATELSIFNLENLAKATEGADQLRALINKLLNIARIERGDMEIFIEKLNLSKLVHENVDHHMSMAAAKEQKITYKASTDSAVYVPADSASIVEVVNNLIGNAIKYTGKGGKVKVNLIVEKSKGHVRVEVIDTGPGIPEELRDRLFTKFYRAERSLISGTRGTGLGLFISRTIIELQNGTIGIEPDNGDGSTFYFTLPLYDPDRDDEQIAKKSSGGIRGWFKKHPNS